MEKGNLEELMESKVGLGEAESSIAEDSEGVTDATDE